MDKLIAQFPNQISEAIEIGESATINKHSKEIKNIVISGLGGSGIGGAIVKDLVASEIKIPIEINNSYTIPNYVNESTLFIVSSYSGNTEETLEALKHAIEKNAKIVGITSGGQIAEICKEHKIDLILVPPGSSSPRACLGYSMVQQFYVLHKLGLIDVSFKSALKNSKNLIVNKENEIKNEAQKLAQKLHDKLPIIYAPDTMEGVAVRLRQQINENAKMLCWHHVIPEMNHNELVGWRSKNEHFAVIVFRNKTDYARIQKRIEINKEIFKKYTSNIFEIWSKGDNAIEKAIYCIHLGDWLSFYLSELRGVDSIEVKVIDHLKAELAK